MRNDDAFDLAVLTMLQELYEISDMRLPRSGLTPERQRALLQHAAAVIWRQNPTLLAPLEKPLRVTEELVASAMGKVAAREAMGRLAPLLMRPKDEMPPIL